MTAVGWQIIKEVAERQGVDPLAILSKRRFRKLMCARIEIAKRLDARGYSLHRIGSVLNRDHSTIFFYLGRSIKKPSRPRWRKPVVKHVRFLKVPRRKRRSYLVPYAGAYMPEYEWKERSRA